MMDDRVLPDPKEKSVFAARLDRLAQSMAEQDYSAVAVNAGPSLSYLSGLHFHLMERPVVLVLSPTDIPTLILPELEQAKLDRLPYAVRVFAYGEDPLSWPGVFAAALSTFDFAGRKIGVEPAQLRFMEYGYLQKAAAQAHFCDGSALFAGLRAVKDDEEIARIRRAVEVAEQALESTLPMIRIGITEQDIAAELFLQLLRHGSDSSLPFAPIVASGPNGANPHAQPSGRPLAAGDLLVIDWGASCGGYISDLTRTFAVGEVDAEAKRIHRIVEQANGVGRAAGRPQISCATVDRAARQVVDEAGYGQFFFHRTGHGIGMECHETPYIRGDNEQLLQVGMVYTIEPGIYLAGRNGVRIEDDVLVTATGALSLSTMSRELRSVG